MDLQLLKTLAAAGGIGGSAMGVFLLIAQGILKKNIFPTLQTGHGYRLLRLMIILAWSVAVVGIVSWVFVEIRPRSTPQETKLTYKTMAIENTWFLQNTVSWDFKTDKFGEDNMSSINKTAFRAGLVTDFPTHSNLPRIPANYMYINFTIENHGNTLVVVDEMKLIETAKYKIPKTASINEYKPALDPQEGEVTISARGSEFPIYSTKTYKYGPNEIDIFRLKVIAGKDVKDTIVKFMIAIRYHDGVEQGEVKSDKEYLLSSYISPSPEQEEAASRQLAVSLEQRLESFNGVAEAVESGDFEKAEQAATRRIEVFQKYQQVGLTTDDGGPNFRDCLFVRALIRLYRGDEAGARADLEYVVAHHLTKETREDLLVRLHKRKEEFKESGDGGRAWVTEFVSQGKSTDNNLTVTVRIPDVEINPPPDWAK